MRSFIFLPCLRLINTYAPFSSFLLPSKTFFLLFTCSYYFLFSLPESKPVRADGQLSPCHRRPLFYNLSSRPWSTNAPYCTPALLSPPPELTDCTSTAPVLANRLLRHPVISSVLCASVPLLCVSCLLTRTVYCQIAIKNGIIPVL